jgi:glyoxylase-like metal-dependent hydrolase (beta-lactamase superfamily II)
VGTDGGSTGDTDDAMASACPPAAEVFPDAWPQGGPACGSEPALSVHRYDDDTFIIRQSLCTSFEAPFIYLLFGEDRVLMEDSGAGGVPIRDVVFDVIAQWLERNDRESIELVLINSHAHGDHVAGNGQFEGVPGVEVVGFGVGDIATFFDIDWPEEAGEIDLGGRVIDVLPIPGHEASHVALYDRNDQLLLTGDTVYPGRLFIDDFQTYTHSLERLTAFSQDNPVCWVLGTHIEMTDQPGVDFQFGVQHHPDEHMLQMTPGHLVEIVDALRDMGNAPRREAHDDFIVFPL